MIPTKVGHERAHLRGKAFGTVRFDEDEPAPVDGIYDVSTICVFVGRTARHETVAFKVSGVGPEQISEPYRIKTLTVTAV